MVKEGVSSFARTLAGTDSEARHAAVEALGRWIIARTASMGKGGKSEAEVQKCLRQELLKVLRGAFYTLWHADGSSVQEEVCVELARLTRTLSSGGKRGRGGEPSGLNSLNLGMEYFTATLLALRREWFGIDKLRIDKFMLLVRRLLEEGLVAAEAEEVGMAIRECIVDIEDLKMRERTGAVGLSMHLAMVLLSCIKEAEARKGPKFRSEALLALVMPFVETLSTCSHALLVRVEDMVLNPLIEEGEAENGEEERGEGEEDGEGTGWAGRLMKAELEMLAAKLFDIAGDKETREGAREMLYEIQLRFEKAGEAAASTLQRKKKGKNKKMRATKTVMGMEEEENNGNGVLPVRTSLEPGSSEKKKKKKKKKRNSDEGEVIAEENHIKVHPSTEKRKKSKSRSHKEEEREELRLPGTGHALPDASDEPDKLKEKRRKVKTKRSEDGKVVGRKGDWREMVTSLHADATNGERDSTEVGATRKRKRKMKEKDEAGMSRKEKKDSTSATPTGTPTNKPGRKILGNSTPGTAGSPDRKKVRFAPKRDHEVFLFDKRSKLAFTKERAVPPSPLGMKLVSALKK